MYGIVARPEDHTECTLCINSYIVLFWSTIIGFFGEYQDGISIIVGFIAEGLSTFVDFCIFYDLYKFYNYGKFIYYSSSIVGLLMNILSIYLLVKNHNGFKIMHKSRWVPFWVFDKTYPYKRIGNEFTLLCVTGILCQIFVLGWRMTFGIKMWLPSTILQVPFASSCAEFLGFIWKRIPEHAE